MVKKRYGGDKEDKKGKRIKKGEDKQPAKKRQKSSNEAKKLSEVKMKLKVVHRINQAQKALLIEMLQNEFLWLIDNRQTKYQCSKKKKEGWKSVANRVNNMGLVKDNQDFTGDDMQALMRNWRNQWGRHNPEQVPTENLKWILEHCGFLAGFGRKKTQKKPAASTSPQPGTSEMTPSEMRATVLLTVAETLAEIDSDEKASFFRYVLAESRDMTEENWANFREEVTDLMSNCRQLQRPARSQSAPPNFSNPEVVHVRPYLLQQLQLPLGLPTPEVRQSPKPLEDADEKMSDALVLVGDFAKQPQSMVTGIAQRIKTEPGLDAAASEDDPEPVQQEEEQEELNVSSASIVSISSGDDTKKQEENPFK